MLCSFKGTSHVCCHFLWNTAPLKESWKVLLHLFQGARLRQCYIFPKHYTIFPDMCHFWYWNIAKQVVLHYCMCLRIQHYFKKVLHPDSQGLSLKAILVQSTKQCNLENKTQPFCAICPILLQKSTASTQ